MALGLLLDGLGLLLAALGLLCGAFGLLLGRSWCVLRTLLGSCWMPFWGALWRVVSDVVFDAFLNGARTMLKRSNVMPVE